MDELLKLSSINEDLKSSGSLLDKMALLGDHKEFSKAVAKKAAEEAALKNEEQEAATKKQEPDQKPEVIEPDNEKGNKDTAANKLAEPATKPENATPADAAPQKTGPSPEKTQAAKARLHGWIEEAKAKQADKAPSKTNPEPEAETPKGPGGR